MRNRRSKKLLLSMVLMVVGLSLTILNIKNDPSIILAIGMILTVIGLFLSMREVYKKERLDLIDDINASLLELGYTKEQIKDEIKALKSKVDVKIKRQTPLNQALAFFIGFLIIHKIYRLYLSTISRFSAVS
ncbi:hypothetical protein BU006_13340 [Mammaliicoccus sciuri]|uniref:hypothetical protein n=1 Tax=Mammaliicoccus TaxID=2803850 RepID=UPI000D1FC3D2|nr:MULTISPECIES: hypothetical protein [Mammaliicoccus]MCJ0916274.1 hypothetical protein [Mammaliicoccus sciuri]MCJ0936705.1 hypothetical protein [Mammaliicoccus sciuri]PTJ55655.1 hypothetical protein BU006_13340 [Mammaliicoccus sciuri]